MRPRAYELWGDYRGMTVLLFSSDEEREYGQVDPRAAPRQGGRPDGRHGLTVPNVFSANIYPW